MKCYFIFILIVLLGCSAKKTTVQDVVCTKYYDKALKTEVYIYVDDRPAYPQGDTDFGLFLVKNIRYQEQAVVQGKVSVSFIVDKTGAIKDIKIYKKAIKDYTKLDQEMLRVLHLMPKWKVGKCNGKKVPVLVTVPIHF